MNQLLSVFLFLLLTSGIVAQQKETPLIDSLKASLDKEQNDTTLANAYNRLAEQYRYVDPDLNREYALKALKISRKSNFLHGMQSGYNLLAQSYENQGLFAEAIVYYDSSLAVAKLQNSKSEEARVLLNISNVYQKTADYSTASQYVMNSLTLQEELKDTFGIAVCKLTLGNLDYGHGDYREALRNYISALELNRKSRQNPMFEASTVANIGAILVEQGSYDSALVFFRQSLVMFQNLKASAKTASAYNNVGACLFHLGKFDSAKYYLHTARAMNVELQRPEGLTSSLMGLGNLNDSIGNKDSALYYYRAGFRIAMQYNLKEDLLKTYISLADEFEKLGKPDSALHYLRLYIDLNELLHGEEELRKIENEAQNYSIRKKQEELKQQEAQSQLDKDYLRNKVSMLAGGVAILILLSLLLYSRFRTKKQIAIVLENTNKEIMHQKDEITDSINYARRIQDSILAPVHAVKQVIPESFILYLPKDVVSGDFYWVEEENGHRIFASVDCTGHGVPGALMSVVGFNLLNRAVKEMHLTKPSEILRELDYGVNKLLRQSEVGSTVKDGMDISLCSYLPETRMLQYAGAFNPLYIVRDGQLSQVKADKSPIGVNVDGVVDSYTNHEIAMLPGDMVYLFSDGYADQFGGPAGKKLKYKRLRELLVQISGKSVEEQEITLRGEFNYWKGDLEQVDDVLIIGMRVR
jgi:serine phosphatase RsbU (regulator of sigma subunit)/Tfp pilus assembly protein PilF